MKPFWSSVICTKRVRKRDVIWERVPFVHQYLEVLSSLVLSPLDLHRFGHIEIRDLENKVGVI